jgi:hypothetical protein
MAVATKPPLGGKPLLHVVLSGDQDAIRKLDAFARSFRLLGGWKAEIASDSDHIGFVIEGTRPHTITARRPGGMLRFEGQGGAVFRRSVRHPGTRANPFVQRAFDARRGELEARAVTELERGFDAANPRAGEQAAQLAANVLLGEVRRQAPVRSGELRGSLRARFTRGGGI